MRRLADHGDGIGLVFARTETVMFFETIWSRADAVLFIRGRLNFHYPTGERATKNAGGPSVLVAYGRDNAIALRTAKIPGRFIIL